MAANYLIAGICLTVEGDREVALLDKLLGFEKFVSLSPNTDLRIVFGADPCLPDVEPFYSFDFKEAGVVCALSKFGNRYAFSMHDGKQTVFRMIQSSHDSFLASSLDNLSLLRFALWMAFSLFALPLGVSPVHASTVVYHDKAVLFLGESGTGKSTHARLWISNFKGAFLLNDDSPIVSSRNGAPLVYGSPWSGKTHCYHNASFPLAAVVRLRQASCNHIKPMDTLHSFAALQPSLPPALSRDDFFMDHIVELVSLVVSSVPVFMLSCLPDVAAANLCFNNVFRQT